MEFRPYRADGVLGRATRGFTPGCHRTAFQASSLRASSCLAFWPCHSVVRLKFPPT
jgi:hypothetical protein